ncbi:MAG TPA: cold shock domain-containing protein [Mucilaginibacter sp.]|jgi:cold shock CspA family protein|nr:cold shock domain-containing protein [Mucilaginibacter sp.]
MAKSSETFNKKEKEKKRLKKQQEKKEKAEQRKANSSKGKGLDEMMAYIDENGDITTTPPVAGKRKPVVAADIELGVPRRQADDEDNFRSGVISFFNTAKGYGFIRDSDTRENVFFHVNGLSFEAKENDKVRFATERGPKGLSAIQISKV